MSDLSSQPPPIYSISPIFRSLNALPSISRRQCPSVRPSACLCVYLPLSVWVCVCVLVYIGSSLYLYYRPFMGLSLSLYLCLSFCGLSSSLLCFFLPTYPCLHLNVSSNSLILSLSTSLFSLSVCLPPSVCLTMSVSLSVLVYSDN